MWWRRISWLFPSLMVLNGGVDLFRPEPTRVAMDSLSMPHYLLLILGAAKILGGLALLVPVPSFLREWAFAGFFIWCIGGLACHALSGHRVSEFLPLLGLGVLLLVTYVGHHKMRNAE